MIASLPWWRYALAWLVAPVAIVIFALAVIAVLVLLKALL